MQDNNLTKLNTTTYRSAVIPVNDFWIVPSNFGFFKERLTDRLKCWFSDREAELGIKTEKDKVAYLVKDYLREVTFNLIDKDYVRNIYVSAYLLKIL